MQFVNEINDEEQCRICKYLPFRELRRKISEEFFSSYNKQWQDAQIAMVDMLALETPEQPRAPESVCSIARLFIERFFFE